jgi:cytochrome c oxidase subunit II
VRRLQRRHVRRAAVLCTLCCAASVLLGGCGGGSPSALDPHGPKAEDVTVSWWILFAVAAFVCVLVIAAAILAAVFRRRVKAVDQRDGRRFVLVLGVVLPSIVFAATFALSVTDIARSANPPKPAALTVEVIGHQWWWEVRYPGRGAITANEVHVPVGMPVHLKLRTADVIHSFWVPQVMPKRDLLPKRVNETWISVNQAGTYRGECAEYCGVEHALMDFSVVAQPRAEFRSWMQKQADAAQTPTTAEATRGREVFTTSTCATCHTVRGTSAHGHVGPDLTHVGGRSRLAAGAIPNDFGHMAGWVADSQSVKPGNKMPPQHLSPDDLRAVVTYLQGLK